MVISRVYVFNDWHRTPILLTSVPGKANILIDQTGNALLADFGLLTISDPANPLSSGSHMQGGTARWMAPELIDPQQFELENSRPTKHSDCYALGMVIYETISGHLPFHRYGTLTVVAKILKGQCPHRGTGFTQSLWEMLETCWTPEPDDRPSIEDVLRCLERVSNEPELPPMADEEMGKDGGNLDSTNDYLSLLVLSS